MYNDNRDYASNEAAVIRCNTILEARSVHGFAKDCIKSGLQKDMVDAVDDLELALGVLKGIAGVR